MADYYKNIKKEKKILVLLFWIPNIDTEDYTVVKIRMGPGGFF